MRLPCMTMHIRHDSLLTSFQRMKLYRNLRQKRSFDLQSHNKFVPLQ